MKKLFNIQGRVQGVYFRRSTCLYVDKYLPNLRGQVRNLEDGSVEVVAIGSESELSDLEDYLKLGPETAVVDNVIVSAFRGDATFTKFSIARSH